MNVLVTGGAGYIGSHISKQLALDGYVPICFDNLSTGHRWAVQWGPFVKGDLADQKLIVNVIREYRIEAIVHVAASAYVEESIEKPVMYFRNNVANLVNLLEAMVATDVGYFVLSSSCSVYGATSKSRLVETHSTKPLSPYGESKLMAETMIRWFGSRQIINWITLRYFNAAGADPDGQLGEDHLPETHLIPRTIMAALGETEALDIFGDNYNTPDGTAVRDYVHVSDLAAAHVRALRGVRQGFSGLCNLGSGRGVSVREVVSAVREHSGRDVPVRVRDRRPGDSAALVADITRARSLLGWTPRNSDIETIVSSSWEWHTNYRMQIIDRFQAATSDPK